MRSHRQTISTIPQLHKDNQILLPPSKYAYKLQHNPINTPNEFGHRMIPPVPNSHCQSDMGFTHKRYSIGYDTTQYITHKR